MRFDCVLKINIDIIQGSIVNTIEMNMKETESWYGKLTG